MAISILRTIEELTDHVVRQKASGRSIGVVPTMGALHEGHLSLVRASLNSVDETIVTIFVNPTQFAAGEDLGSYPRTLDSDVERLDSLDPSGSIVVFAPAEDQMYPADCTTRVTAPLIAKKLEGEFRPTHFDGVVLVVLKLLNLTRADLAFFGQKDFQQVAVIKQMVNDLNVPCKIIVCPIARDPDGLAMSSRNVYLSASEREIALSISKTLDHVEKLILGGLRDGFEVITEMRQALIDAGVDSIDYAVIANPVSLETSDPITLPAVALIAVHVGDTRLIDNRIIKDEL
ncbi:MAG: pantoate--beta-alanine ligase [Planctomycetota bacterium]